MENGISVIIPAYNREEYIQDAILSILNQNYTNTVEIILSDDGSTDGTISKAGEFGDKVRILRKPEDCTTQGAAGARNRGIRAATQPYICFLDSDDFYLPGHFIKMAAQLDKHPGNGFVFCRSLEFKAEDDGLFFKPWTRSRIFKNDIRNIVISRKKIILTNCILFRRTVFEKVGYFNETFKVGEDGDMWIRISEQFRGTFSNHFGTAYRTHHSTDQLTGIPDEKKRQFFRMVYGNAKKRYYELHLKDQRRIYRLKLILLQLEPPSLRKINLKYHFVFFSIAIQHPLGFFQSLLNKYYEDKEEREKSNQWNDLSAFIA